MNSKRMAKRKKDSGVSPVIATILMVAITVVLAAVLYVMVSGFTHSPGTANSAGLTSSQNTTGIYTINVNSVSNSNIKITTLKIVISGSGGSGATGNDGSYTYSAWKFTPAPATVTGSATTTTTVYFYVLSGNSATYLNVGDLIVITTSSSSTSPYPLNHLGGATVTLYNGNSELGSVAL